MEFCPTLKLFFVFLNYSVYNQDAVFAIEYKLYDVTNESVENRIDGREKSNCQMRCAAYVCVLGSLNFFLFCL